MNEREIFAAALECPTDADRRAFLDGLGDPTLCGRIEALLEQRLQLGSYLEHPPVEALAAGLDATILLGDGSTCDAANDVRFGPESMNPNSAEKDDEIPLDFLHPSTRADSLGRLAHYEILEALGQGAFGIVLKAFDEKLQRVVAIKVLSPHLAATSPARKRFTREARASAKVRHENVVSIYAVEDEPIPYLVMEYIPGETLQKRLDDHGPLDLPDVLRLGKQIADGLAAAHTQDLIHRDVKPGNILLDTSLEDHVKITDFGLARTADDASMTQSGMIAGTPLYMAPEQALGYKLDQRADLFSFGSVLYQMLTGRPPFRAPSTIAVLKRVTEDTPRPIQEIIPEVPDWMCALVGHLHAKQPDERYGSAKEVSKLLAACLADVERGRLPNIPAPRRAIEHSNTPAEKVSVAEKHRPRAAHWAARWPVLRIAAVVLVVLFVGLGISEATGVSRLTSTVIRLATGSGTLVIETDDPDLKIAIDGEEVTIRGGGVAQLTLRPGPHKVAAIKNGKPWKEELVTITRNGRKTVQMSLEPAPAIASSARTKSGDGWYGWPKDAPPPAIVPFDAEQAKRHQQAWAHYLGVPVEYENSIGMKFRLIPPGEFLMGSTPEEIEAHLQLDPTWRERIESASPQHGVILTRPIYLGVTEVTQSQFEQMMGFNPSAFSATGEQKDVVANLETKNHPAETVSWNDAAEFCAKLSQHEALKPFDFRAGETVTPLGGTGYRLATEAEWEFACRAGTTTRYWSGDRESDLSRVGWFRDNSGGRTHAVGELKENPFGLYDVHGNVWEWVQDCWDPKFYGTFADNSAIDPICRFSAVSRRSVRGGVQGNAALGCRSSIRHAYPQISRRSQVGFRVVLAADASKLKPGGIPTPALPDGWVELFNGRDLTGWRYHVNYPGHWKVEDGVLTNAGSPTTLFLERTDLKDFHLRMEVKIDAGGGSGVYVRGKQSLGTTDLGIWPIAPAGVTIIDDSLPSAVIRTGGSSGLGIQASSPPIKPGEWFVLEVLIRGDQLETRVNGHLALKTQRPLPSQGTLALHHSVTARPKSVVQFRKIEIKELPPSASPSVGPPLAVAPFDAAQARKHQEAWAKHLGVDVENTNSIGMKLRLIPPGEFMMGTDSETIQAASLQHANNWNMNELLRFERAIRRESPRHKVTVNRPWFVGSAAVTRRQFRAFVIATGYRTSVEKGIVIGNGLEKTPEGARAVRDAKYTWDADYGTDPPLTDDHPVTNITWNDARAFCAWLSKVEGRKYDLPTEAQWEYACRAGSNTFWPWGSVEALDRLPEYANLHPITKVGPEIAGKRNANAFGLFNMQGCVVEWCRDYYSPYQPETVVDPQGSTQGSNRVARGSTFDCGGPWLIRPAMRYSQSPTSVAYSMGFRVACEAPSVVKPEPLPPTFTNGIGMDFVIVPKGKSWLGGGQDKLGDKEAEIPADFYLGKYEVTQEEWEKVMGENPSHFSRTGDGKDAVKDINDADLKRFPVENVSWDQCQEFVTKLNQREKEAGWVYRLPTDVEWEYACRGGPLADKADSAFDFYFAQPTNTLSPKQANRGEKRLNNRTWKVGSCEPNMLGLCEMHSNIAEWCENNIQGADGKWYPLIKGSGSAANIQRGGRAGLKVWAAPSYKLRHIGLRLARVPSGAPSPKVETPLAVAPFTDADAERIAALPANEQIAAVFAELKRRNPGFDDQSWKPAIEGGIVAGLSFRTIQVTDIGPLRALTQLRRLQMLGGGGQGGLTDLSPLQGMKLTSLALPYQKVSDLAPLRGMPLEVLHLWGWAGDDLTPLKGMPLQWLNVGGSYRDLDLAPIAGTASLKYLCLNYTNVSDLTPLENVPLTSLECANTRVSDLTPLHNMRLELLECTNTRVSDLTPLRDMRLELLCVEGSPVTDLAPLERMPLKTLRCDLQQASRNAEVLRGIKTLEKINKKPAAEFWKDVEQKQAADQAWLKKVATLPADQQIEEVRKELMRRNPGFDGQLRSTDGPEPKIVDGVVIDLRLCTDHITDISPVRALRGLRVVWLQGLNPESGRLTDLTPLKDLALTDVAIARNPQLSDLSPLAQMPITNLSLEYTKVPNLAILKEMPIKALWIHKTPIADLSPLAGKSLIVLLCSQSKVKTLQGLPAVAVQELHCDLAQLPDKAELTRLGVTHINGKPVAEFWKEAGVIEPQSADAKPPTEAAPP